MITTRTARAHALKAIATRFSSTTTTEIHGRKLVAGRRATKQERRVLHAALLDAFTRWGGIRAIVAGVDADAALTCWCPSSAS